jgi:hypothetical protein
MAPLIRAGLFAAGAAGEIGLGLLRGLKRREIAMTDYLELPSPPPEELRDREPGGGLLQDVSLCCAVFRKRRSECAHQQTYPACSRLAGLLPRPLGLRDL